MRMLIGYDGSEYAEAALNDLARAGLPDDCEARVISVADVWPNLPQEYFQPVGTEQLDRLSPMLRRAHELASSAMRDARELAEQAAQKLRARFVSWKISADALGGSAADVIVDEARTWRADLIVLGACGQGAIQKALLGSVSQAVVTQAGCSVRIARPRKRDDAGAAKVIIGLDGSPNAAAALNAVSMRRWPVGSEARVVVAVDVRLATVLPAMAPDFSWPLPVEAVAHEWPRQAAQAAVEELGRAGILAGAVVRQGDPKKILIEEADQWQADCIFVGARGIGRVKGFFLGSVSSAVASRANCSVEVVRLE